MTDLPKFTQLGMRSLWCETKHLWPESLGSYTSIHTPPIDICSKAICLHPHIIFPSGVCTSHLENRAASASLCSSYSSSTYLYYSCVSLQTQLRYWVTSQRRFELQNLIVSVLNSFPSTSWSKPLALSESHNSHLYNVGNIGLLKGSLVKLSSWRSSIATLMTK